MKRLFTIFVLLALQSCAECPAANVTFSNFTDGYGNPQNRNVTLTLLNQPVIGSGAAWSAPVTFPMTNYTLTVSNLAGGNWYAGFAGLMKPLVLAIPPNDTNTWNYSSLVVSNSAYYGSLASIFAYWTTNLDAWAQVNPSTFVATNGGSGGANLAAGTGITLTTNAGATVINAITNYASTNYVSAAVSTATNGLATTNFVNALPVNTLAVTNGEINVSLGYGFALSANGPFPPLVTLASTFGTSPYTNTLGSIAGKVVFQDAQGNPLSTTLSNVTAQTFTGTHNGFIGTATNLNVIYNGTYAGATLTGSAVGSGSTFTVPSGATLAVTGSGTVTGVTPGMAGSQPTNANLTGWASLSTNSLPVNYATTNQVFHPAQYGNLAFWFSARSLAGYTNGQAVARFTDASGLGNDFPGTNLTYAGQVGNGEGGIQFGQQYYPVACLASNSTILTYNPGLNTNCTIVIVYQSDQRNINQPAPKGGQFFNSSPRGAAGFGILDNDATGTGLDLNVATNQSTFNLSKNYDGKPVILTIRYGNGTLDTWLNGVPQIQGVTSLAGGLGLAGNLYLGDFHNTSWYTWNGSISELLIYTNALTTPQIHAVNAYYAQAMGVNALDVMFLGDSITTGIQTTNGALWKDFIMGAFPQFQVQNCNLPGLTSGQMLTNVQNHIAVWRTRPGMHIVPIYAGVNDNANGISVATTETNLLNLNTLLKTNGFSLVPATLISQAAIDVNGYRTNFNNWLMANSNQFVSVIRYDLLALGTNGAYSNTVYMAGDQTHPLAAAYNLMSNNCVSGIQYAVNQLIGNAPLANGAGLTNIPAGQLTGLVPTNSLSTNTAPRAGSIYGRSGDNATSQWMQHDLWDGTNHILEYQSPYGITNQLTSTNGAAQLITWWQGGSNVLSFPTNTTQPLWNGVALTGNNGGSVTNLPATNLVGVLPQASIPYAAPLGIYFTSPYTNNISYYVPPPYYGASSSTIGSYQCFCPAGFSGHITNCIISQTVNNLGVGTNISVWAYSSPSQGTLLGTLNGAAAANQITNCVCNFAIANATNIWCVGLSNNTPAGFGPSLHASAYFQVSP